MMCQNRSLMLGTYSSTYKLILILLNDWYSLLHSVASLKGHPILTITVVGSKLIALPTITSTWAVYSLWIRFRKWVCLCVCACAIHPAKDDDGLTWFQYGLFIGGHRSERETNRFGSVHLFCANWETWLIEASSIAVCISWTTIEPQLPTEQVCRI